ncbi:MAG: cobalamin biosynthesis protein CbiN [Euryarchaeota archaeon]|nr:cobalamin biosynthesis protein CbiN [Euryarchaeota archaeon]
MSPKDRNFVIGGIVVALIIAFLAPFLASTNPDGLESAAEKLAPNPEPEPAFESPLPDYTLPTLGEESSIGGAIAIILGTLVVFALAYGVAEILKRQNGQ